MIIALMLLWSLVAVSLVRFLYRKRMKWAALAYGVLYIILTAWMYFLFAVDVAHLGFGVSRLSVWNAGSIYSAFADVNARLFAVSEDWLIAVVFLCAAIAISVVCYLVISSVQLVKEIYRRVSRAKRHVKRIALTIKAHSAPTATHNKIYLTLCRLLN
jgi:hypothetical protein